MNKNLSSRTKRLIAFVFFSVCLTTSLFACSVVDRIENVGIYKVWVLSRVVYESGDSRLFSESDVALVEIHPDYILESMGNTEKRRYLYERKANLLILDPGLNDIKWEITKNTPEELNIKTPIGDYILRAEAH
ncbi:MAG: hypothetical protein ACRBCS_08285 [Cellvibrionaceae bacterium]